MQCSVILGSDQKTETSKMRTYNKKNSYKKESNIDNIVDQLCTRLQDIKDQEERVEGMLTYSIQQTEAIRRYCAAFPALERDQDLAQYCRPPPVWCRKPPSMQPDLVSGDWGKSKKPRERRNSHGQRRNRRRSNTYSRSMEVPEWFTYEGSWDLETQDPVREFIRAIAVDEGYATCENTVSEDPPLPPPRDNVVPDWDDGLELDGQWIARDERPRSPVEPELYARFEAKFDRSLEALWEKRTTPDDEYQDLPIDLADLLSSPSDRLFQNPSLEKRSLLSLADAVWASDAELSVPPLPPASPPLHDRLRPLHLADPPPPPSVDYEPFAILDAEDVYEAFSSVAPTLRSLTAINHSRDASGFVEVLPRPPGAPARPRPAAVAPRPASPPDREDLLTSARTHFRPIKSEASADVVRYGDGATFDISGELDTITCKRSDSGGVYIGAGGERYLEYRSTSIDYSRLRLTEAQQQEFDSEPGFRLRFPLRQKNAAVQTEDPPEPPIRPAKKKKTDIETIWSEENIVEGERVAESALGEELSREWEELLSDISAAHAAYTGAAETVLPLPPPAPGGKRRHSAALREPAPHHPSHCSHPHARFLHCCAMFERPLTR